MNSDGSNQRRLTYFNDSTSTYWTGASHILGHGCYNTTGNRIIADVGGNQPIQTDPSQIGQVYLINLNEITTKVNEVEQDYFSIRLYPNPASDLVKISTTGQGRTAYNLYNFTGALLCQGESTSSTFNIDVNSFSNGFYIITANENGHLVNAKFAIEK